MNRGHRERGVGATARNRPLDLRVYLVTSGHDRRTVDVAAAAARGGAGMVQVRCPHLGGAQLLQLTIAVAEAVARANPATRLVVDDRTDIAWAARNMGAPVHGVHLGQSDLPPDQARDLLGPEAIIGWTADTLAQVEDAERFVGVVDYLGSGPLRPTPTKQCAEPALGFDGYPPLVAASSHPVVAIGDIAPSDMAPLARSGVAGAAMVRALMTADDPETVVRECLRCWDAAPC